MNDNNLNLLMSMSHVNVIIKVVNKSKDILQDKNEVLPRVPEYIHLINAGSEVWVISQII